MAGPYYNPYMPQQMQQQMNAYMPAQYMPPMPQQYMQGYNTQPAVQARMVTGREEAIAAQIPQDGSMCIFSDTGHGMIYTKQLNMQDGSAVFREYRRVDQEQPKAEERQEYALKSDFDRLRTDFDALIRQLTGSGGGEEK